MGFTSASSHSTIQASDMVLSLIGWDATTMPRPTSVRSNAKSNLNRDWSDMTLKILNILGSEHPNILASELTKILTS